MLAAISTNLVTAANPKAMLLTTSVRALTMPVKRIASTPRHHVGRSNPENFPKWAPGFCKSIRRMGDTWIAETSGGPMKVRFAEKNAFRVADHYVTPPTGGEVYVPLRVLANGAGSEVVFTLFPQPAMSAEKFQEDARLVQQDLNSLKRVLENRPE